MRRGLERKFGTDCSINEWVFTKLTELSGNVLLSFTHSPGLGDGI